VEALVALPQLQTLDGEGYEAEDREEASTVRELAMSAQEVVTKLCRAAEKGAGPSMSH